LPPTLRELGLTWNDSSRWQAIARIPREEFEGHNAAIKIRAGLTHRLGEVLAVTSPAPSAPSWPPGSGG
jgi:hypothetical protein